MQGVVDGDVVEERHDVDEVDSLDREVHEMAQGRLESHLCTGEFGGGGGGGGGLSSRGILILCLFRCGGRIGIDRMSSERVQH